MPPAPFMIVLAAIALTLVGVVIGGTLVLWRVLSAGRRHAAHQRAGNHQPVRLGREMQGAAVHIVGGTPR